MNAGTNRSHTWLEAVRWMRQQPELQEATRAAYLDLPLEEAATRFLHSEEWAEMKRLTLSGRPVCVLEVGAGNGVITHALLHAGCKVTAIEPDPGEEIGRQAIKKLCAPFQKNLHLSSETAETFRGVPHSYDLILGHCVLHHASDISLFIKNLAYHLKPGGTVFFSREHVLSNEDDLPTFLDSHPLHKLYGGECAYTQRVYERAFLDAGLQVTSLGPYDTLLNAYPITSEAWKKARIAALKLWAEVRLRRFFGCRLTFFFCRKSWFLKILNSLFRPSLDCDLPGRLFTFIAKKHA